MDPGRPVRQPARLPVRPHYRDVDGLRLHQVDEGPAGARPVLLLRGEPTWSYLCRRAIPVLAEGGHRVIAPDLVGFGRSDKPTARDAYTYQNHVDWIRGLITALDPHDITVVGHDWGGFLGRRLAAEDEDRFAGIVAAHTARPTTRPSPTRATRPAPASFRCWYRFPE